MPNALIADSGEVGFVEVGGAGRGDPHVDVADLVRSLRSDLNPQFGPAATGSSRSGFGGSF